MTAQLAYVGIGTNLGDRFDNAERALDQIRSLGTIVSQSSFYRTKPWGNPNQPWFLNAVVALKTALSPHDLLQRLHAIERRLGRVRGAHEERWAARTIDLDLLLYDDLELDEPDLRVPHPHLGERAFVLVPLAEIDDRFAAARDALDESERAGVTRIERESETTMPEQRIASARERIRALTQFLSESDAVRVRIERDGEAIEIALGGRAAPVSLPGRASGESAATRVDTIKADLVGIFRTSRPAPAEGDAFEGDRELGYVEALGIRTPIHSMGPGRIVAVRASDGTPVEYGQPLFLIARGR